MGRRTPLMGSERRSQPELGEPEVWFAWHPVYLALQPRKFTWLRKVVRRRDPYGEWRYYDYAQFITDKMLGREEQPIPRRRMSIKK